jgi:preprotein translocase subunit Sss1
MQNIDERFDRVEAELKDLAASTNKNLSEIKTMLTQAKDEKFKTVVTVAGTIIVALLGVMGYLITHLPK